MPKKEYVDFAETVPLKERLDVAANERGTVSVSTAASDGQTTGESFYRPADGTLVVRGERTSRSPKEREETMHGEALAEAVNGRDGSSFVACPKTKDDGDVPDIWLTDGDQWIGVQMRHFDEAAIKALNRDGRYGHPSDVERIVEEVRRGSEKKQKVDLPRSPPQPSTMEAHGLASRESSHVRHVLLLIAPFPFAPGLAEQVCSAFGTRPLDHSVYDETWLSGQGTPPFPIECRPSQQS